MTEDQYQEWVCCGRLPTHRNGKVDFHTIERAMRDPHGETSDRVALLKRVAEHKHATNGAE